MEVIVKEMPAWHVAYARHVGPYLSETIGPVFCKLMTWAGQNGHFKEDAAVLGVSWDCPQSTPPEELRYDACITVPPNTPTADGIELQTLPAGLYAVYHCEVVNNDFQTPWTRLMQEWLPSSGYRPDGEKRPSYERYYNNAEEHPEKKWIIDICLPVTKK